MTQIQDPVAPGFAGTGQTQDQHLQALGNYEWGGPTPTSPERPLSAG